MRSNRARRAPNNEAGYTNTLLLNGTPVHSTAGLQDNFNPPYWKVGSPLEVFAGSLLDSVPEPGTALLLGTGLLGALIQRRRKRSS